VFRAVHRPADSDAYCELNFSPSGEWAMYGFVGYRRGMTPLEVRQAAAHRRAADAARFDPRSDHLPRGIAEAGTGGAVACRRGAVIEEVSAGSHPLGAHAPGPGPDFHHAQGFVLEIGNVPQGVSDLLLQAVGKATT
jgi:hypothetical protein